MMPIRLDGHEVSFPVFVGDISDRLLLGSDFLHSLKANIDMADYSVTLTLLNGRKITLDSEGTSNDPPHPGRVLRTIKTDKPILIKPKHEITVHAY